MKCGREALELEMRPVSNGNAAVDGVRVLTPARLETAPGTSQDVGFVLRCARVSRDVGGSDLMRVWGRGRALPLAGPGVARQRTLAWADTHAIADTGILRRGWARAAAAPVP
eukprot:5064795-Prymnesium_polylepis.1